MVKSSVFRNTFLSHVRKAVVDAKDAEAIDHHGLKGTAREIFVAHMLAKVLPPEVKIGGGKLVSHTGLMSSQMDVVLYSPAIMPPALFDTTQGLFPIEAALYTIEVKSKLTATTLKEAIANARSIQNLPKLPTDHWFVREVQSSPIQNYPTTIADPITVLFAFDTDLTVGGMSEMERYRAYDEHASTAPAITVICVVGRGYWYRRSDGGWTHMAPTDDFNEIMCVLGGITNTLPELIFKKGRPRFGNYLILPVGEVSDV